MEDSKEDELERLAREEIMKEARRGAERAKEVGAYGWMKPSGTSTNKKFLGNVLVSTLRSYKRTKKHSHDHDDRHSRRHRDDRHSHDHSSHRKHNFESHKPKLVNNGYFRYNDPRIYSKQSGKNEERKDFSSDSKRKEEINKSHDSHKKNDFQDQKGSSEEKDSHSTKDRDEYSRTKDRRKKRSEEKKKSKDRKLEENNNENKQQRKSDNERPEFNQIEEEIKGDNCNDDLVEEYIYHDDTMRIYRKRKNSSKSEEDHLIEDIKKHKDLNADKNPEEKLIDFVGDYLIDKRQKKKSKHKEKKSHKAKHKHKKHHKHKTKHKSAE